MTTTMIAIPPAFERLREEGLLDDGMVVLTGGVAVNRRWSEDVAKADGYGDDAWEMIRMCKEICAEVRDARAAKAREFAFSDRSQGSARDTAERVLY